MKVHLHIDLQEICPIEWAGSNHSRLEAVRASWCPLTPGQIHEDYGKDKQEKAHQQQEAVLGQSLSGCASRECAH